MRSPLATALLNPFNLAMPVLSIIAGLVAAWWLCPLGLLLWVIMVAVIANDKSLRINYNMEARLGTLSGRFREPYARAVRAQMRIFNSLLNAGGDNRSALEPVQVEIERWAEAIYGLCQQMTAPENFLAVSRSRSADPEGERALLVLSISKDMDPAVKQEKETAIRALDGQIQKIKSMALALERVDALLGSTTAAMESLPGEIMRLQVVGAAQTRQEVPALLGKIRQEIEQLEACKKEIAHLV